MRNQGLSFTLKKTPLKKFFDKGWQHVFVPGKKSNLKNSG